MDVVVFHRVMREKYAERQRQHDHRVLWMRKLAGAALVVFWLSFAFGYLLYAAK